MPWRYTLEKPVGDWFGPGFDDTCCGVSCCGLVHDWKARLGCDAVESVGRSQSVIVVRDDLGVLEIIANQFESKAETAHKICGLAQKWQIGDWMGPPTLRYQELDGA